MIFFTGKEVFLSNLSTIFTVWIKICNCFCNIRFSFRFPRKWEISQKWFVTLVSGRISFSTYIQSSNRSDKAKCFADIKWNSIAPMIFYHLNDSGPVSRTASNYVCSTFKVSRSRTKCNSNSIIGAILAINSAGGIQSIRLVANVGLEPIFTTHFASE